MLTLSKARGSDDEETIILLVVALFSLVYSTSRDNVQNLNEKGKPNLSENHTFVKTTVLSVKNGNLMGWWRLSNYRTVCINSLL